MIFDDKSSISTVKVTNAKDLDTNLLVVDWQMMTGEGVDRTVASVSM